MAVRLSRRGIDLTFRLRSLGARQIVTVCLPWCSLCVFVAGLDKDMLPFVSQKEKRVLKNKQTHM
jgi:hypothetical protein